MFQNYFKTALRNLLRGKASTFINIVGLGLGLAALWASVLMSGTNEAMTGC